MVLEEIGRGAMGVVYRAYDPELDRKVALKLVLDDDNDAGERVLGEARALARTTHPNVLTIHDVGTEGGRAFIAMELVDGSSLAAWNEKRRGWREVVPLFVAAGSGLAAAHAAGLVHRDFKPSNVLLTRDGRVLVTDFGLARPLADTSFASPAGTPAYMGPEQFVVGPIDARADQFAICVALFELLWGVRPFDGATGPETSARAALGIAKMPRDAGVPRWLRRIVLRGLSPEPSQRFATMDELLAAMRAGQRQATRARVGMIAAGGVAVLAGLWLTRADDRCESIAKMDGAWDGERAAALGKAFVASTVPYASDAAARARAGLDEHAAALSSNLRETCTAAGNDAAQHRKLACLVEEREHMRALVDLLVDADDDIVERSFAIVGRLKGSEQCDVAASGDLEDPATRFLPMSAQHYAVRRCCTRSASSPRHAMPPRRSPPSRPRRS